MIKAAMFDTKPYDRQSFDASLVKNEGISVKYFEPRLTEDTVGLTKGYDCVITFVNDDLNTSVIDRMYENGVKLIALRCAGFNNVDVKEAFGKIHIVRVPAYSPHAVAEHAMALLLTSVRRIHKAYNRTREFNFSLNGLTGFDLYGKTVGVIGTGKIGRLFADICKGFGMKVLGSDPFPAPDFPGDYVELDKLFSESDIISLHCPLTEDNMHLINKDNIEKMKNGAIIINTSRGALIDAEALLCGLKSKKIGAACLDVYEEESDVFFEDKSGHIMRDDTLSLLLSMPNVLITSHQAFLTEEALGNISDTTVNNIHEFFSGNEMKNEICYHCGRTEECRHNRRNRCF